MGMIPIKIHAYVPATAVTADGELRPSEKGMVEVYVPEAILRAGHPLPANMGLQSRLLQPVLVPVNEGGVYTDPQSKDYSINVIEVPYAGWHVDTDEVPEGEAEVHDAHGHAVVTFHHPHPETGASPREQARSYLDALRRGHERPEGS